MLHHTLRSAVISYNDPNFENVTLLLPGNGTNGAQNNTFIDSSTNNFTITRNGDVTQGTFSPYGTLWSNFFDGSGDYLSTPSSSQLSFTGNFTLEAFVYVTTATNAEIISKHVAGVTGWYTLAVNSNLTVSAIIWDASNNSNTATSTVTAPLNTWVHISGGRNGSTVFVTVNGVYTSVALTVTPRSTNNAVAIGCNVDGVSNIFTGYISNARVVASAVYTGNFVPPSAPLAAITNTRLLTCQNNRFIDVSSNNFTITRNGNVSVQRFSPFESAESYRSSALGGSGYFDGVGDYLNIADAAALDLSGDFTVECWVYWIKRSGATFPRIITKGDYQLAASTWGFLMTESSGLVAFNYGNPDNAITIGTLVDGCWTHLAVSRSSTTLRTFFNGSLATTATVSQDFTSTYPVRIGAGNSLNTNELFSGYVADARIVKGTAVYTAAFTPPTSPLTAIANTSLLASCTNAGIIDNAMMNDLRTVGNAQISTAQSRWGGSSILFDGTGDWLILPHTVNQQFFSGNFTIEFWLYLSATGAARGLVAKGTSTTGWLVSTNASNQVVFTFGTSTITSTDTVSGTTWTHIAVAREGTGTNQTKIYINGINSGTGTVSTNFNQTAVMYVGADRTAGNALNGYIDDLRITNGLARYTANFTPPLLPFPTR